MNNKEFVTALASETHRTTKDTEVMVRTMADLLGNLFEERSTLVVPDFGTFEVKKKLERIIVNPGSQQRMLIPPKLVLTFKPTAANKETIKKM